MGAGTDAGLLWRSRRGCCRFIGEPGENVANQDSDETSRMKTQSRGTSWDLQGYGRLQSPPTACQCGVLALRT